VIAPSPLKPTLDLDQWKWTDRLLQSALVRPPEEPVH
jgi:hypothetical protein